MNHNIKCLDFFTSFEEIYQKYKKTATWQIRNGSLESRSRKIQGFSFYDDLKERNKHSKINANYGEIVSWLDSLSLLMRMFEAKKIDSNGEATSLISSNIKSSLKIAMEYQINFCNHQRIDYLLLSENKILILEFSYKSDEEGEKLNDKLFQAIRYKELLSGQLSQDIRISQFVFLYEPEFSYTNTFEENISTNNNRIDDLANLVNHYFKKDQALEEIESLEEYRK